MQQTGKFIAIAGAIILIIGIIIWGGGGKYLQWFGHLPGDIRIEKENTRFYMPITSMIIVSIVLSIILWIIRKLMP